MPEQTIIIATDASDQAEHAVKWYLDHVHMTGNKIVFVNCIELPEMKLNQAQQRRRSSVGVKDRSGSMHMSPGVLASMWKEEEQKSKQLEDNMKDLLKQKEAHGVLRTVTGKPGEQIVRIAEEENADMIVTGTRGMGKVRRTILGSVSDYLVHHAHCPVIVCRYPCKSRHASGSGSESGGKKSRNPSGDKKRHSSGDSFTGQIRARLASLGKSRSQSVTSEKDEEEEDEVEEERKNGEPVELIVESNSQ